MRTGPLVDALIEHPVDDPGRYGLETAFMSSWRAPSWHELTHGRAAGCSWVTSGRPGRVTRRCLGPGRSCRGPPWFCDGPVPPFRQVNRTPTGPAWHTARGMMGMQ